MSKRPKIRAVIADIYHTLFEVGPPPPDAAELWEALWEDKLADPARLTLGEFAVACQGIIGREHGTAIRAGVQHPEIYWPAVAMEALPELARLAEPDRDEFLYQHARLQRTVRLMPGVAETLPDLARRKVLLGLVSNCQPYTLRELDAALDDAHLSRALFVPELCFFSFAAGFSKPNPHAFRFLSARLQACGVSTAETVVVGDRVGNDLEPARAQGFQTWLLRHGPVLEDHGEGEGAGDWGQLRRHLAAVIG